MKISLPHDIVFSQKYDKNTLFLGKLQPKSVIFAVLFPKNEIKNCFWELFGEIYADLGNKIHKGVFYMRKKNYNGKCQKRVLPKCKEICKTYDDISYMYADILQADTNIQEIRCNKDCS